MSRVLTFVFSSLVCILISSCGSQKPPVVNFSDVELPAAPDYSKLEHWAAHPDVADEADGVPLDSLRDKQGAAKVDVFFIHPTTFRDLEAWNGDLADKELNQKTDESAMRHQASIFNGAGRVYAPRYRQMTYPGFFSKGEQRRTGFQAYEVAYQDVKLAFEYYLENENEGRPFILAGHSQGTAHGIRLVREFIDGKPLSEQLVAAYLVGWPFPADTFEVLRPCENPGETGCYASWCTFAWDYFPEEAAGFYKDATCTNPVTWTLEEETSPEEAHKGLVMQNFSKTYDRALEAKVEGGILWITKPDIPFKVFFRFQNYHIADYNLFWLDVRQNAELRAANFLEKNNL